MNSRLNLVPGAYRQACRRRRHVRVLVAAATAAAVVQVVLGAALNHMAADTRDAQRRISRQRQDLVQLHERLARLTAQENRLDREVVLLRHLTRKHRWSEILDLVSRALPETVLLTRVESIPAVGKLPAEPAAERTAAARPAAGRTGTEREPPDTAAGLLIGGLATDHESVALFLRQLKLQGSLGSCALDSTQRRPFLSGQAVGFTIRTQW